MEGGGFMLFGVHITVDQNNSNVVSDIRTNGSTSSAIVPYVHTNGLKRQHSSSDGTSDIPKPKKERRKPRLSDEALEKLGNELKLPTEIIQTIIEKLQIQENEMKKPKLLMVKILSATDMKTSQSRLLIPPKIIKDLNFITEQEQKMLHETNVKVEVNVFYKDREGKIVNVVSNLGRWPLATPKKAIKVEKVEENAKEMVDGKVEVNGKGSSNRWNYVIQKTWVKIMNESKLEVEDVVQLWWFRYGDRDEKLGLVLLKVDV